MVDFAMNPTSTADVPQQHMAGVARLSLSTTSGFLVAGVIVVFLVFLFLLFCYLRSNRYWGAIPVSGAAHAHFAPTPGLPRGDHGLDAAASLPPPLVLRPGSFKEGLECPVCLSELAVCEAVRLLPMCGHAFHLHCIDTWFCAHSTCPLCRTPAALEASEIGKSRSQLLTSAESISNTTASSHLCARIGDSNSQEGIFRASSSVLPVEVAPEESLPASRLTVTEESAPAPKATLRPLRWLLVRGNRTGGASGSPSGRDVEQGRDLAPTRTTDELMSLG
ncbi:RING-H2 finger protein ATL64-like [Zingiber officinale]|uniref:RING-type domain-containing protein n=1 Tax=Zingiber officinale TaxID=94328 RepID=A0A8J5F8J8_ZINOF|nr:RING-H2 finger protein ATL64-like [Zingiber officinale]KAG6478039.1 hypothetical protein ZIOFF_061471 [Zingiber officinale]